MNDALYERLREAGWRRPLTAAEQVELRTWLAAHPESRADWAAEAGLNATLGKLADAPLPSNFTARVLQEIEREGRITPGARTPIWREVSLRRWLPRFAVGAFATGMVLVSVQVYTVTNRVELGKSVVLLSEIMPAPTPDLLRDFDSIEKLDPTPTADTELLALLQ